jgi:gamma-glutamyltranspeptidase/glutathione hydrolase
VNSDTVTRLSAAARFGPKEPVSGRHGAVCTSHPLATRAAADMLRAGGNACDAALTAAAVQTVVEPHMTTAAGVLGLLYYDAATAKTTYLNASINAPLAGVGPLTEDTVGTGLGVAVPGWWAGFEAAAYAWGSRPLAALLAEAIGLADEGFPIHAFLYGMMFEQVGRVGSTPAGRDVFFRDGQLRDPGDDLRQPALAETYRRLVREGSDFYYRGAFADEYCALVQAAGGRVAVEDFRRYEVMWQTPVEGSYRGRRVLGSPPPDAGGLHVIEALNMLEHVDLRALGRPQESAETLALMMAVCQEVLGSQAVLRDPGRYEPVVGVLTSKAYAEARLALLSPTDLPGPAGPPGTAHIVVVDAAGNAASLLHSLSAMPWDNGLFVGGVSIPAAGTHFLRACPRPGERAVKYVAPTMLFDGPSPSLVMGSPSVSIVANIVQNVVNVVDFGDDLATSVGRPRFGNVWDGGQLVEADFGPDLLSAVAARGVGLNVTSPWSVHNGSFEAVAIDGTGLRSACADPRRAGSAEVT